MQKESIKEENLDSQNEEQGELENPEEGENASQNNDSKGQDDDLEAKNKQLFARLKKAEEERDALEAKLSGSTDKKEDIDIDKIVDKKLAERELNSMELPDSIKEEIKIRAQVRNISYSEAAKDPVIQILKEQHEKEQRVANASVDSSAKGTSSNTYKFDPDSPPEIDPDDPESFKRFDEWEKKVEKIREEEFNK